MPLYKYTEIKEDNVPIKISQIVWWYLSELSAAVIRWHRSSPGMGVTVFTTDESVQIDWQLPLSGVHSIMMVSSAQPGERGGCKPSPFHSIYHHEQSCCLRSIWDGRSVLRIHEIFVRIRIRGFIPLPNGSESRCGSGSCYFRQLPSIHQLITFWRFIYIIFQR